MNKKIVLFFPFFLFSIFSRPLFFLSLLVLIAIFLKIADLFRLVALFSLTLSVKHSGKWIAPAVSHLFYARENRGCVLNLLSVLCWRWKYQGALPDHPLLFSWSLWTKWVHYCHVQQYFDDCSHYLPYVVDANNILKIIIITFRLPDTTQHKSKLEKSQTIYEGWWLY